MAANFIQKRTIACSGAKIKRLFLLFRIFEREALLNQQHECQKIIFESKEKYDKI